MQATPILNAVQPAVPEQMHTTEPIAEVKEKEGVYVKSPAVGVFYAAPSPDSKPFVAVGDTVPRFASATGRSSNTTSRCSALFKMKSSRSAAKKCASPGFFRGKEYVR